MKEIIIHTDGAARGNPGPAGAGATLKSSDGVVLATVSEYLNEMTNNQAEYHALILALNEAIIAGAEAVKIYMDSELIVKQIKGEYRVKNEGLKPLYDKVVQSLKKFNTYTIEHVRREKNKEADKLANLAIDDKKL
ncbi:MAG: ribonuclease HI family protein [Pseudomonadota bacterium]